MVKCEGKLRTRKKGKREKKNGGLMVFLLSNRWDEMDVDNQEQSCRKREEMMSLMSTKEKTKDERNRKIENERAEKQWLMVKC